MFIMQDFEHKTLMVYSSLFMEKYAKKIFLIETMKIGHRVKFVG